MSVGIINKQIEERASLQKNFLKTANMLFGKDWNELTKEELYQTCLLYTSSNIKVIIKFYLWCCLFTTKEMNIYIDAI